MKWLLALLAACGSKPATLPCDDAHDGVYFVGATKASAPARE